MSRKANPTVIGAFVLGAIGLIVTGILVFGSGRLFKTTNAHVLHFQGSVKGLKVGSPVTFRGVRIGQVSAIKLLVNSKTLELSIPVLIEIDPSLFQVCCDDQGQLISQLENPNKTMDDLIDDGLRGQLAIQSLVTGQLIVDLDFFPDTPINLAHSDLRYHEIPTIRAPLQNFFDKIGKLPIDEITQKVTNALDAFNLFMSAPELKGSVVALEQTLTEIHNLTKNLDQRTKLLTASLDETISDSRKLFNNLDSEVKPLSAEVQSTAIAAQETLEKINMVMKNLREVTSEDSELRTEIMRVLREVTEAIRSVRVLTENLDAHPESLLRGKTENGGQP